MPFMFVVILWSARVIVRRFSLPAKVRARLGAGFVALGLLVAAKVLLAVALQVERLAGASPGGTRLRHCLSGNAGAVCSDAARSRA